MKKYQVEKAATLVSIRDGQAKIIPYATKKKGEIKVQPSALQEVGGRKINWLFLLVKKPIKL